ncbi:S8 family peptidase [Colwellia psychrerythraea]|uniref:Aqualysin 1 n=1 Tax=Colwellia psychrerythraea TaxID=28229 RepID=A0A099KVU4_COLPS|nr:S8 family peptidase [Colwellia psychrerythraea]KGJ93773.1 Aqualysin 1 [Colwellia psychrerythraea]
MNKLNLLINASLLSVSSLTVTAVSAIQPINSVSDNLSDISIQISQKNEYLVTFKPVASLNDVSNADFIQAQKVKLANNKKISVKKVYKYARTMLIQADETTIATLRSDENVLSITLNSVLADMPIKPIKLNRVAQVQNGDDDIASWGLDRIDQRYLNLDEQFISSAQGTGVTAYVLDTGTVTTSNEFYGKNGESRLRMGYNPFRDNFDSADCHGHGSHVAGTVGGSNYGVAKNVNVVAVRVMECGEDKTVANIIEGMNWVMQDVANHQGPAVVNISLSDPDGSVSWDNATQAMIDAGITVVVAAGNNFYDACKNSPARLSDAITVGATDKYDFYNNLSNYGACVDILAPGSSITSIDENAEQWTISGTSMAAPHVTGAAALVLEKNPNFNHHQVKQYLLAHATQGVISGTTGAGDTEVGSANKLLYIGDDLGTPLVESVVNSGETVQVQMLAGGLAYYKTIVGNNAQQLKITVDSQAEVDLYVKYADVPTANPINFHNDCKQTHFGGYEVCEFSAPEAGEWHILIASGYNNSDIQLSVTNDGGVVDICDTSPQSVECICPKEPTNPICITDPDPEPNPNPGLTELTSGQAEMLNLAKQNQALYFIDVVSEQQALKVTTSGEIGDVDMTITLGEGDEQIELCSATTSSSNESCVINNPVAGRYFITLDAYTDVEEVSVEANVIEQSGCQQDCDAVELLKLTQLNSNSQLVYPVTVPAGKTLTVTTNGGLGDVELMVNYNVQASSWWSSDCFSLNSGNDESCEISNTQAGTYYIVLKRYEDFKQVTLTASYQ